MKNQILFVLYVVMLSGCKPNAAPQDEEPSPLPSDLRAIGRLLDSIYTEDQKYRTQTSEISEKYGRDSEEIQHHWDNIKQADSSNLLLVEQILANYGWLGAEQIGGKANSALFLVIQHADQATQEKYLPMMRQAVEEGNAEPQSLALLEDRVGLGKGELQVYGSQIGTDSETGDMYVLPMVEPEKVNARRASVGLGPIEEYVAFWNLEWDVEEYKKKLPRRIERLRKEKR